MTSTNVPPNQTIYVNNLNEKVKIEALKKALYTLFSEYGVVLEIVARKTLKMKGQAFIIFEDIAAATNALRALQEKEFYDKPMRLSYAKEKSDVISKKDGSFNDAKRKARRQADAAARTEQEAAQASVVVPMSTVPSATAPPAPVPKQMPPNNILFVENLPDQANEMMLQMLFQQFPGYKEVRLVPGQSGIAFIEFTSDREAGVAMNGLQGFKITPQNLMVLSFAKK